MRQILTLVRVAAVGSLVLVGAACGGDDDGETAASGDRATIVVTTNVLGDVVSAVVGDLANVEVIMPVGADPHDFEPSVRQAAAMEDADLLVINGANFEEGMAGIIENVESSGTPVFAFADVVPLLDSGSEHADDEHADDEHADDEHADDEHADDEHGEFDPHLWTDPARMAIGAEGLATAAAELDGIDTGALAERSGAYVAELAALDAEIEAMLASIPDEQRVLVTNHQSFGYFADRYGFEVVGTVIPSMTTAADASIRQLEELADLIIERDIPAVFAETTRSTDLAESLTDEVGREVAVVQIYTGSLGEPGSGAETYIGMMRTNAELIVDALTGA